MITVQSPAEALDVFLAGRTLLDALDAECRVAQLADERFGPSPDGAVVYLLVDRSGHVIYIGHSRVWRTRAGQHHAGWIGSVTDHVRVIGLLGRSLRGLALEEVLIDVLQPPYNIKGTSHGLALPRVMTELPIAAMSITKPRVHTRMCFDEAEEARLAWQSSHPPTFPPAVERAAS